MALPHSSEPGEHSHRREPSHFGTQSADLSHLTKAQAVGVADMPHRPLNLQSCGQHPFGTPHTCAAAAHHLDSIDWLLVHVSRQSCGQPVTTCTRDIAWSLTASRTCDAAYACLRHRTTF